MARAATADAGRGRDATRPGEVSAAGWRDVLLRVKRQIAADHVLIIAAGVAFYALLAVFPALAALVSVCGLVLDPSSVTQQLESLRGVVPGQAVDLMLGQLQGLAQTPRGALGWGVAGGVLLALWTASAGVRALIKALNVAYDAEERRSFLRRAGLALLLTLCAIAVAIVALAAIVVLPAAQGFVGEDSWLRGAIQVARWPLVAVLFGLGAAVIYRYGPCRRRARWAWVIWGAVIATVLWLVGSAAFSWYVSHFGSYNRTYGSMGAVVILLLWFLLSSFVLLIGAEINAELERQTRRDTTVGPSRPLGERGARVADSVGRSP
jgi:membrane protein